jgi:hypothetical protein
VTEEWTEVVRSDEAVDDAEARRLLRDRLSERGVNVDDLDLSNDVRIRRYHIREEGRFVRHTYGVLVRTERLPGAR